MDQMSAMQAQMDRLMACDNQRATQQGSYVNWRKSSLNASPYNPYVPSQLNPYGTPYYNTAIIYGNFPTVLDYSLISNYEHVL